MLFIPVFGSAFSMKTFALLAFAFLALLLAGCTQQQSPSLPSPTAFVPAVSPTIVPTPTAPLKISPSPTAEIRQEPAPKPISLQVTRDAGTRVNGGSVPFAFKLDDGRIRLYYCGQGGILSAVSSDGLEFKQESGTRLAGCDPTMVKLDDGRVRMYYKVSSGPGGPGQAVHKVHSAVSSDGLAFQDEGLRIDSEKTGDKGWASVPDAIKLSDGRVRIYYVSGDPEMRGGIASAISSDGLAFTREQGSRAPELVDPAILPLPEGGFALFVAVIGMGGFGPKIPKGIYYLLSPDGLRFEEPKPLIQEDGVYDPAPVWIDGKTIRVFYGKDEGGQQGQPNVVTKSFTAKLVG